MSRPVTATIHADAMRHNLGVVRRLAPSSRVMAMVKADGYGHGLEAAVPALRDADAFGVGSSEHAGRSRALGLEQPVLVLSGFDSTEDLARLRRVRADRIFHHSAPLDMLEQAGGEPIGCWLKIDT